MRQEHIDAIGGEVFALLASLLRPVARCQGPQASFPETDRVALPAQRLQIRVNQSDSVVRADLQLWLSGAQGEPLVFAWVLPMPFGAAVESLDLHVAGESGERAGLCERREARTWFDLARRGGRPGALLSEDAPGVFSLEVTSPRGGALSVAMRFVCHRSKADGDGELVLNCEAASGLEPDASRRARIVRLGSGHCLDSLVGIRLTAPAASLEEGEARCEIARRLGPGLALAQRRDARPGVFASCDRVDGANAMYRGWLAGRAVRLWATLRTPNRADAEALIEPAEAGEIGRLMAQYRQADRSEAERRDLAARVARLGLQTGVATLWTSFVAIVGGEGPGGEMAFAAA